ARLGLTPLAPPVGQTRRRLVRPDRTGRRDRRSRGRSRVGVVGDGGNLLGVRFGLRGGRGSAAPRTSPAQRRCRRLGRRRLGCGRLGWWCRAGLRRRGTLRGLRLVTLVL